MSDSELGPEYRVTYPMNVAITNAKFRCTKCRKWKPASKFGLRCMDDDVIRNQPQCKKCRSEKKTKLKLVK